MNLEIHGLFPFISIESSKIVGVVCHLQVLKSHQLLDSQLFGDLVQHVGANVHMGGPVWVEIAGDRSCHLGNLGRALDTVSKVVSNLLPFLWREHAIVNAFEHLVNCLIDLLLSWEHVVTW